MIATWLDASRWTYNLTVEILQSGIPAAWRHIAGMVMAELKVLKPEWDSVPYQVKRTAVRDACRAMSNVKTFNLELKSHQAHGNRADEPFAQLGYRSRQNPKQSCYIPDDAVTEHGVYHTILGPLRMAEAIPAGQQECRLVQERGRYWLTVPYPAQCDIETPSGDGVVALDPGVRTFLTYFSETDCGKLGHHAFGRIQRLCHWLDDLISRTAKAPNRRKRRQMRWAQARMRQRITNLVDELHWQLARWLTSNYRIILLPTFETHDMTQRAGRRIRSKTARMMLTFRHYEFKRRLRWKAWQCGALVLDVNEAYSSKTRSWDGAVNTKLGGAKAIRDDTGFGMDRDVNGAPVGYSCVACSRRLHRKQRPQRRTLFSVYLSVHQAAALVLARRYLGCSERIPRRWVCPVGNGVQVAFTISERKRVKHVWTYWGAIAGQLRPALAAQHRLGRPNPVRAVRRMVRHARWLERGSVRCSRVRLPGGAVLNCWDGGVAQRQRVRNG